MEYLQNNRWKAASIGILLFAVLLFWSYIIPEFQNTYQLYSNLREKQAEIASVQNWESRLDRLTEQQEKLEKYLSKIFLNLPENDQMSMIVDHVFKQAESGDVKLTQMRPAKRVRHKGYLEIPISLQIQGSYHEIGQFINRIERSRYLMKVEQVNIRSKDDAGSRLIAQVDLKVIILKRNAKKEAKRDA